LRAWQELSQLRTHDEHRLLLILDLRVTRLRVS